MRIFFYCSREELRKNLMKEFPIISGINKLYEIKGFLSAFTADLVYTLRVADYKLKLYKQLMK